MFLSCLQIDLSREIGRRWLFDDYRVHQTLRQAFPDGTEGILYRVETQYEPPRVLVQSITPANWERCFAGLPVLSALPRQKEVPLRLRTGQRLRFLLRANPTARRLDRRQGGTATEERPLWKRVGLFREEEQREWFARKGEDGGFEPLFYRVRPLGTRSFRRPRDGCELTFLTAEFEGVLRVVDPERFVKTVEQGIGAGKAFGFGMLSLAPAG